MFKYPNVLFVRMVLEPGDRLDIPERARKNSSRLRPVAKGLRDAINEVGGNVINLPNENIDDGVGIAALATAVAYVAEDYLPIRLGASISTVDIEEVEGQEQTFDYTLDVNAALENQARLKAKVQSGTGFTSLWSDKLEVLDYEEIATRPARDTYRYKIRVQVA